ncbi:MAG: oligosaccharide flippase family protein [Paludibacteraceae bacterium]|nr:oligosaccharide flippase family protein [Paludibacteraceae bacterium]
MNIPALIKSTSIRNFAKLLSANVVAQVIGLLIYPILTRIYAPEDFGLLNLFLSIGNVLVVLSVAEYHYAIVLPKSNRAAASVFHIGLILLVATCIVISISTLFSKQIGNWFNSPELASYYWLMPIFVLTLGLWNLLNYWYTRHKQFTKISSYQISQSVLSAGGKVGFGYAGWLQGGLVYSTILGSLVSVVWHMLVTFRSTIRPLLCFSWNDIQNQAKEFRNFPLFVMPRTLMNTVGGNLPILLLTPYFGLSEIGFFSLAFTLAFRPINIICSSLYQVLFQKISDSVNTHQRILPLIRSYLIKSGTMLTAGFVVLYIALPWITNWFLGNDWDLVSDYIRLMLPWLLLIFLNTSLSFLPDVFKKQHVYLCFEIAYIILRILILIIGIWTQSIRTTILLYSLVGTLVLAIELWWFISIALKYERNNK